jgi:formamidopyrimidine-DNA glycosylase
MPETPDIEAYILALNFWQGRPILTEPRRRGGFLCGPSSNGVPCSVSIQATAEQFAEVLTSENHTLKRALTDSKLFSGIGDAYSDEILHRACMSPFKKTRDLKPEEVVALHSATVDVLTEWVERLTAAAKEGFPEKVTAFRPEMAVHRRYGAPCPIRHRRNS